MTRWLRRHSVHSAAGKLLYRGLTRDQQQRRRSMQHTQSAATHTIRAHTHTVTRHRSTTGLDKHIQSRGARHTIHMGCTGGAPLIDTTHVGALRDGRGRPCPTNAATLQPQQTTGASSPHPHSGKVQTWSEASTNSERSRCPPLTAPAKVRRSPHGPARHSQPDPVAGSARGSAQGCWRIP